METTKRNLTLSLPVDLIREAKVQAAQRDLSLNALVEQSLVATLRGSARQLQAADELLKMARASKAKIGPWKREDLYARPGRVRR